MTSPEQDGQLHCFQCGKKFGDRVRYESHECYPKPKDQDGGISPEDMGMTEETAKGIVDAGRPSPTRNTLEAFYRWGEAKGTLRGLALGRKEYTDMNEKNSILCKAYHEKDAATIASLRAEVGELFKVAKNAYLRLEAAVSQLGIYPKTWEGEWDKRTRLQDHWNDNLMELTRRIRESRKAFEDVLAAHKKRSGEEGVGL